MHSAPAEEDSGLLAGLAAALRAAGSAGADALLEPLGDSGLAHSHVRLRGTGLLARVPKQSQLDLDPVANLAYQRACFERAAASGHTPRCAAVLAPQPGLPRGALLVEEIVGRPATLPRDLPGIAATLAALHALPVPPAGDRPPLLAPPDALAALWSELAAQAVHLQAVDWPAPTRAAVREALAATAAEVQRPGRPEVRLIAFDAHPGNYLARAVDGRTMLVDLEKCRYGYPGLDLAHATLYTSTTWDAARSAVLTLDEVLRCYADWEAAVDAPWAMAARPWHAPLRRAMWLWSLTWCAKWLRLSARPRDDAARGEDWSAQGSSASLVRHVRERVGHYLSPAVIAKVQREIAAVGEALA